MTEWKTDTEEVKQIVKACRDFKRSLQEEKCTQFIKDLDSYAREILLEHRKIERQLQEAIEELRRAKSNEKGARIVLRSLQVGSLLSSIWPPARIVAAAVAAAEMALKLMKEDTEKCERNVELLVQVLEIYSTQAKASVELVEGAWEGVKKALNFYTDKHQEFIKRLNKASEAIDNGYNIAPPEVLKERDFESPAVVYNPKKSVFDERLKDLREDFSFSLYADLKDRINASSKSDRAKASKEHGLDLMSGTHSFDGDLSLAKKHCVKNCKKALQDFTEKIKKSPNDLNAINEAFSHLKTELERVSNDERLKGLRENLDSLYADLKDKIHHNALSNDELDRMIAFREREFEKNLEDLMPSSLGVPSYDESLSLAKERCVKNCKEALQDFGEKIKESPNDLNAMNEAFDNLETELERATENLSQKIVPVLERYENDKRQALGYGEFLEKEKESFMVDEQNPYPEEVRFNELRLAEFESVFSVIVPLEDLDKTVCAHHALKALEAALKNRDLGFDATELEQIAKGFIPKGYLWHFDANVLGNLALVKEELLLSVKHTKGYSLWKQFLQTQN
ncbi:5-methyltetrahydrofolate--homocysteine methyltransferase [Helicobacter pylori]|uniref:HNH endonuclease signature motif containing protein n=1 Tax=Helicobacter pylori TaxID=210 RepID=UPI00069996D7|nr:HNH endonuclease [Helicobacter pylori]KNX44630.1 5-methyltetrahydrofolate--homocysteine methyltransferase [Helicobacter pylori]